MGANLLNDSQSSLVMHLHEQPVVVAFDVEHDSVSREEAGARIAVLDVLGGLPFGLAGFLIPGLQGTFGVGVPLLELDQLVSTYDAISHPKFPFWEILR